MKLALASDPLQFIKLEDDYLWVDEFQWQPRQLASEYSVRGALLLDENASAKQSGRPITLQPPDSSMAWIRRSDLKILHTWMTTVGLRLRLVFEYSADTRTFLVIPRPGENMPLDAKPIKGFPGYENGDWYQATIKLTEVEP